MSEAYTAIEVKVEQQEPERQQPRQEQEKPILFMHAVERHYRQGDETLHVLNGAELALWSGQSIALVAPSGAGKSTLLHVAGLLEHPDHGDVYIDGRSTAKESSISSSSIALRSTMQCSPLTGFAYGLAPGSERNQTSVQPTRPKLSVPLGASTTPSTEMYSVTTILPISVFPLAVLT